MKHNVSGEPQQDKRLSQMIMFSAILHVAAIALLVRSVARSNSTLNRPIAYTVELVNPAALGTNLPAGGGGKGTPARAPVPPPQPQQKQDTKEPPVAKKEEPKITPPVRPKEVVKLPEKDTPVEKPPAQLEPERAKVEEKKPEAKKAEVKPEPEKVTAKAGEKKPDEKKPAAKKPEPLSPEERDKQILAALEKIKAQVGEKDGGGVSDGVKGSGPITKGGEPGEGGGGVVRGLEFIMYTAQVQQRMQESWIVTEKKPGLVATVSFKIQPDGEVLDIELIKPSGDTAFDQSVMRAVRKANPLPPPPQTYLQEFATQKIVMNFGGEGRVN